MRESKRAATETDESGPDATNGPDINDSMQPESIRGPLVFFCQACKTIVGDSERLVKIDKDCGVVLQSMSLPSLSLTSCSGCERRS